MAIFKHNRLIAGIIQTAGNTMPNPSMTTFNASTLESVSATL